VFLKLLTELAAPGARPRAVGLAGLAEAPAGVVLLGLLAGPLAEALAQVGVALTGLLAGLLAEVLAQVGEVLSERLAVLAVGLLAELLVEILG
jgi:hypothetical protein